MYPILFHVFGYPISTFGLMMALGFLVSAWIVGKRLAEHGLDPELSSTILIYAMLGGVLGSKLYFAIDQWALGRMSFSAALFNRAGITWYGGLLGGTLLVILGTRIHHISTRVVASCVARAICPGLWPSRKGARRPRSRSIRPSSTRWSGWCWSALCSGGGASVAPFSSASTSH